ncbi:MAG: CoA pyrophosphatase [Myxococcota bacterium]
MQLFVLARGAVGFLSGLCNPGETDYPPGVNIDRIRDTLHRHPPNLVQLNTPTRHASVALVIRPNRDLLMIRRAEREGDPWSGHMAFPGGRREPVDPDHQATATRETFEEVGLQLPRSAAIGRLDDTVSPSQATAPRLVISAFVFAVDDPDPTLTPNGEVASTHWFHLDRFLHGEGRTTMQYQWNDRNVTLPAVYLDDQHIWGLSLRILDDFVGKLRR